MKNHEINYLKEKLISERKIAVEGVRINQELIADSNIKEDLGELSSYDNHPADQGSELFEKEKQYALEKHNINYPSLPQCSHCKYIRSFYSNNVVHNYRWTQG